MLPMLQRLRQAGLVWPTLATLAGLAVLIGLGTWQLERKRWKEDLLARIAAGVEADPIPLSPVRKEMLGSDAQTLLEWLLRWHEPFVSLWVITQLGPNRIRDTRRAEQLVGLLEAYGYLLPVESVEIGGHQCRRGWRIMKG